MDKGWLVLSFFNFNGWITIKSNPALKASNFTVGQFSSQSTNADHQLNIRVIPLGCFQSATLQ
jgi:hypothetical protein